MPSFPKYLILICVSFTALACDPEKKDSSIRERGSENNFFEDATSKESLDTLQNELNRGESELLRKFAVDPIPWQKWEPSILEKAEARQAPIFLYIVNGLSEESRSIAIEISKNKAIREILMDKSVCSVADIQINPELGVLAHHLATEINQPTAFPTLLWMSHEGAPIAWLPISRTSGRNLEIVINSSAAMVDDIWTNNSKYAVNNSRMDNQRRQERYDAPADFTKSLSREEAFRLGTRGISALYSEIDKNIDHTGGLIPSGSLELLSLGAVHKSLTPQVSKKCVQAISEVSEQLMTQALKDQLDGSYFYARRNAGWSLPIFSKNLETQTNLARFFVNAGVIIGNKAMMEEGRQLLEVIKRDWIAAPMSYIAPLSNPDREGSFIFDLDTLKKVLTEEEVKLASVAYSLKEDGNIPGDVDPLGIFFQKNTLRRELGISEISEKTGLAENDARQKLEQVRQKLLAHRTEITEFLSSSLIDAGTFSQVVRAQLAGANALDDASLLAGALQNAALLRKNYHDPAEGLRMFPDGSPNIPARSKDYSLCALASLDLYQTTLDPAWLKWSIALMDEALLKLSREGFPLQEMPESEAIIPLKIHNRAMIFSDSSVGTSHQVFQQLAALTGEERFQKMADLIARELTNLAKRAPVNHSDFLISCARGDDPIVAVVRGNDSAVGKSLLKTLNSPKYRPFITIRKDQEPEGLKKLPDLPALTENAAVTLFQGSQLLGSASSPAELSQLLEDKISKKE